ncbi:hypothetical protein ACQ143_04695 [Microbacterium sp. MC2]
MRVRRPRTPAGLFVAAAGCYGANCALGTAVALRLVDSSRFRWVHHALYIATTTVTALALSTALWGRPRTQSQRAALATAPAMVPLAVIPFAGTRTIRHPLVALAPAPFLVAGIIRSI